MSLESANRPSIPATPEAEGVSYVDPILFEEGAYADQQNYEQTIDALADRINRGLAVPRGREPREASDLEGTVEILSPGEISAMLQGLSPDLRVVVEMFYLRELSANEVAKQLEIPEAQVASRLKAALRILTLYNS